MEIENKIANSGLITIDLEELSPQGERVQYDLAQNLWQGLVLKEKEFRDFISKNDWSVYKDKFVAIHCSADAIIPTWAYMLLVTAIQPHAKKIVFGDLRELEKAIFHDVIASLDPITYSNARVVVKGCSDKEVPASAYVHLTEKLLPVVKSLMFGEPCSTVPLYKKK